MGIFTRDSIVVANQESGKITMPHTTDIADYATPNSVTAFSSSSTGGDVDFGNSGTAELHLQTAGHVRGGFKVATGSALIGETLQGIKVWLRDGASASGTITFVVRDSGDSIVATLGTLDASTLTGSLAEYEISGGDTRVLQANDRVLVEYSGAASVRVAFDASDTYDSTNTHYTRYNGSYTDATSQELRGAAIILNANNAIDDDTSSKWSSNAEANPSIELDCTGADVNLVGVAIYGSSDMTETELTIDVATEAASTTWINKRTIDTSLIIADQWNYIRFNAEVARYLRIRGSSGSTLIMSIAEIKYRSSSSNEIASLHTHLTIDETNSILTLKGS